MRDRLRSAVTASALPKAIPIARGTPHPVASGGALGPVHLRAGAAGGGDGTVHVVAPAP